MNFKIENNYINITNYPYIEKHFENMANQGWLIHKIIGENIFIYKRIMPEELDFAISLYEIETAFTKKAKEELKEFQSVCQSAGWNYATRSTDLHIYFKEKGSKAVDIETDDEEEFITIEKIVKKRLLGMYLTGIVALFVSYVVLFDRIANVELIRNGLLQVLSPFFPLLLIFSIGQIIRIKRFLKVNGKNIETGEELEFQNSKFYFEKAIYFLTTIIFIILIVYTVWIGFILKNNDTLTSILPTLIAISIASIYRILAKPSSRDSGNKKSGFLQVL